MKTINTISTILLAATALCAVSCQSGTAGYYNVANRPRMTEVERAQSLAGIRAIEDEGFLYRHRERMSQAEACRYANTNRIDVVHHLP